MCSDHLRSTACIHGFSDSHSIPWQDGLFSNNLLTTTIADALGLHFRVSSPLKGEVKGEGDNRAGRSRAIGSPHRSHPIAFFTSLL